MYDIYLKIPCYYYPLFTPRIPRQAPSHIRISHIKTLKEVIKQSEYMVNHRYTF